VLTFVQKLTEVVRDQTVSLLVASQRSGISRRRGTLKSDKLVSRIDAKKEPVSGDGDESHPAAVVC